MAGVCLLLPTIAAAQLRDGATQQLQRQQERERVLREQQETQPGLRRDGEPAAPTGNLPVGESPCFRIDRIVLDGELSERFGWALRAADPNGDPATGRCLGTAGVNLTLKRVQNAILVRGYITTRVLAAPQDLASGTLALSVVPGRIRAVRFLDGTPSQASWRNALPTGPGELLNLRDIEQGLENLQRIPTVSADLQIVPAEGTDARAGDSDLAISWQQRKRWRANLSLDDSGSEATGKLQAGATLSIDNGLRANDLFYANVGHSVFDGDGKGTASWTAHYDLPYGHWLAGITAGSYDYRQTVAGPFQHFRYSGTSDNAELRVSRLLFRNAHARIGAHARGWWRQSDNFVDDTEIEVQRRRTAGWELGLTHRQFIGPATFEASAAYRRGTGAFGALRAPEEIVHALDPSMPLEGTSRMRLAIADAQLAVPFRLGRQALRYTANWRAQWNDTPLSPQERFAIGGRYTVRGFDGEVSLTGERGWLLRNDLSLALGGDQAFYLGADYGQVGGPATQQQLGDHLAGAVIGLRGGWRGLSWDAWVGAPIDKPRGFPTAYTTFGFTLGATF
ncbi:MAG TPA: ShlB/FhaC/HecB family hemolysin secretion/activation protein [Stenotrophomonas sp.]